MNKNKLIVANDIESNIDDSLNIKRRRRGIYNGVQDTDIIVKVHGTDEVLFRGSNKIVLAGSDFTACKHFDIKPKVKTPTYNEVLKLDHTQPDTEYTGNGYRPDYKICLFNVGVGGCNPVDTAQRYVPKRSSWISEEEIVPFRYRASTDDLTASMRKKYFGRQLKGDYVAYNFKAFDAEPEMFRQYTDGTPIDENVYLTERTDDIEIIMQCKMSILKEDCREFFKETVGLDSANISSISLLYAYPVEIDGYIYYQDVRPATRYNFATEQLIDLSKGIDFIYNLYY